ncbi:MAG: hypothetical protein WCE58_00380, partial [Gallionella sp.]
MLIEKLKAQTLAGRKIGRRAECSDKFVPSRPAGKPRVVIDLRQYVTGSSQVMPYIIFQEMTQTIFQGAKAMNVPRKTCRIRKSLRIVIAASLVLPFAAMNDAHACATCGCSLSTDAAMGYSSAAGFRVSLEYDYINQNQLRTGTGSISPSQVAAINDAGGNQEVEQDTINRYITLGLGYAPNADWNFKLLVPYID